MNVSRLSLTAIVCTLFLGLSAVSSGCVTSGKSKAKQRTEKVSKKKKASSDEDGFGLVSNGKNSGTWVRRGRKAMGGPALDAY